MQGNLLVRFYVQSEDEGVGVGVDGRATSWG